MTTRWLRPGVDPCSPLFFFSHPPTTCIYTLSLHDALPIFGVISIDNIAAVSPNAFAPDQLHIPQIRIETILSRFSIATFDRSEEHTSELQSQFHLVCRLLLEKKNQLALPLAHGYRCDEQRR